MHKIINWVVGLQLLVGTLYFVTVGSNSGSFSGSGFLAFWAYALLSLGIIFLVPRELKGYRENWLSDLSVKQLAILHNKVKDTVLRYFDQTLANYLTPYVVGDTYILRSRSWEDVELDKYAEVYERWRTHWHSFQEIKRIFSKEEVSIEQRINEVLRLRKRIEQDLDQFFDARIEEARAREKVSS